MQFTILANLTNALKNLPKANFWGTKGVPLCVQ